MFANTDESTPAAGRRAFLRQLTGAAALVAAPALLIPGRAMAASKAKQKLAFVHTHTSEQLALVYRVAGQYVPQAISQIRHLLRDFRTNDSHPMDPNLLDWLHELHIVTGSAEPFQIISAYRSPRSNAMLRGKSSHSGVAKKSQHMEGKAIDIRLADVPLADLRDAALSMKLGGVGYYPGSNFIHIDTGRVRSWS